MTVDTTKPTISRIYDYVLGGHHNFEIDRLAAEQLLKNFPSYPRWARLNRWFLQMVAQRWSERGQSDILDLGSGMPTQGHLHHHLPDARIVYSDYDPITVAYAREVLGQSANITYIHADVREPSPLLAAASRHLHNRKVAIGCIGIAYFLDEASLSNLLRELYAWAEPGSELAISFVYGEANTERNREADATFRRLGSEVFSRDVPTITRLAGNWRMREVQPLAKWLNVESMIASEDREGANVEMYGALLEHEGI